MSELRPQIRRFIGMWSRKTQTHRTNRTIPWYSLWGGTHNANHSGTVDARTHSAWRDMIWARDHWVWFGRRSNLGFCNLWLRVPPSAWVIICNNLRLRVLCGFPVKRMRSGNVVICTCFDVKCDTKYGNVPIDIDLVLIVSVFFWAMIVNSFILGSLSTSIRRSLSWKVFKCHREVLRGFVP